MTEPMTEARLAEIEAAVMKIPSGPYVEGTQHYPLMTGELLLEVRRLRDFIRDVAAAPRGSQPDERWPYLAGLAWSVIPREFLDKLDREVGATARPMEITATLQEGSQIKRRMIEV